jgi:2-C-methyl-D-erythritol 2,4-cyclodiphosphate synthase
MPPEFRAGIGYDVHPFAAGRKLVLGGVEIAYDKGLSGWSDADVLTHAIIDALLGAANLGDIGQHFPAGNEAFHNVSSVSLLVRVKAMLDERCWEISNIDANIIAEQPKLFEALPPMQLKISSTLGIDKDLVSVKAKSGNGLGWEGRGDGIAAQAVAMILRRHCQHERRMI